jgi:pyruvate formate lyase activating enzyme
MTVSPTDGPKAVVCDIQRLSLDDGPGIRTTVFLKGCPLRCAWCHNPESWESEPRLAYTDALCRFCGECERVCPTGVHSFLPSASGTTVHWVDWSKCTACGKCVEACPYGALEMCGREYSVGELLDAVDTDRPYYGIGEGGGVTLSGGEPMASFEFVEAFLRRKGTLHVCLDTSGQAPGEQFERVAGMVDLFLFDYKATPTERHRELCGEGSELILANLRLLCRKGANVLLRLPLVPGVNDSIEHLREVASLLKELPQIRRAQIMPYHSMGSAKETRFGLDGRVLDLPGTGTGQTESWLKTFASLGALNVFV